VVVLKRYQGAFLIGLGKALNRTRIPQKQEAAAVKVNINEGCVCLVTIISC